MIHGYALLQGDTGSGGASISLSASHADIGDQITITGTDFGESRGTSTVEFGEPRNAQGWSPVTREAASYVSWSDAEIVVTVPSMSPGKSGETGTYHNVRVYTGGEASDAANFYIDPVTTLTEDTSTSVAYGVCANVQNVDGTDYTTTWTPSTATFSGNSTVGIWPNANVSDVLFDGVTFTATQSLIRGYNAGVLTLGHRNHQRLTFLNCTFSNNLLGGTYPDDAGVNGVKVNGYGGYANNDLSFVGCSFGTPNSPNGAFGRMGYEQVEESPTYASLRTAIIDCTFEPVGGECISFNLGDCRGLTSGCTFKGFGVGGMTYSSWGGAGCWETNRGRYHEIRDCEFWAGYGPVTNISEPSDPTPRHLLIHDNIFDFTHVFQNTTGNMGGWGEFDIAYNTDLFDNYINTGTSELRYRNAFILSDSTGLRCDGSVICGYVEGGLPTTSAEYCLNDSAGTNNTLPTVVSYSAYPHTGDSNYPG